MIKNIKHTWILFFKENITNSKHTPISDKLIAMRNLNTYINWKHFDFEGNNTNIKSKSIKEIVSYCTKEQM